MLTLPTTHASLRFNVTYIYVTLPDVIHWHGGDGLTQVKPGRLMLSNNPDRNSYRGMPGQYGHRRHNDARHSCTGWLPLDYHFTPGPRGRLPY